MFWTSYVVAPIHGHDVTLTADFWHPGCHRIRNLAFPDHVVETFGHFDTDTQRVTLRSTYIDINFTWLDRLRAPWWFIKQWL